MGRLRHVSKCKMMQWKLLQNHHQLWKMHQRTNTEKLKFHFSRKNCQKTKKGKIDTSDIGLDLVENLQFVGEAAEEEEEDRSPVYEDEEEEIVYDIEEEGEESEFDWFADEDAEDESSMLSDFVEVEEEFEEESEGVDERKAKKEPKKKVPLFKLQAKNSKNQDKPQKVKQVSTKPMHGLAKLNHEQYVQEMCRCRTSMEHYRVKNYLHKWS